MNLFSQCKIFALESKVHSISCLDSACGVEQAAGKVQAHDVGISEERTQRSDSNGDEHLDILQGRSGNCFAHAEADGRKSWGHKDGFTVICMTGCELGPICNQNQLIAGTTT